MAQPSNVTVPIDGAQFNAASANFGIETYHDGFGMPMMGSLRTVISCIVDVHDTENMPFASLQKLYDLANIVTRDKVKDVKIEFWQDESQNDAITVYSFQGWISAFHVSGGGASNHLLNLKIEPVLDKNQFVKIAMSN